MEKVLLKHYTELPEKVREAFSKFVYDVIKEIGSNEDYERLTANEELFAETEEKDLLV